MAIEKLRSFPSIATRNVLKEAILNNNFFYRVRMEAADALSSVLSDLCASGEGGSPDVLIRTYRQLFCVVAYPHVNLVKENNFKNFSSYFLQKCLPVAIAKVRNTHSHCPKEVLSFIMDLIKFSNNESNQYHDGYYKSALVDALATYVTPPIAVLHQNRDEFTQNPVSLLQQDIQTLLQEVVKFMNMDKILPSFKYSISVSCLKALRVLQYMGHLPSSSEVFKVFTQPHVYYAVREAAFDAIIDIVQADQSESDLHYLLDVVEDFSQLPSLRLFILHGLAAKPPFTRRSDSTLNSLQLVERMWTMICRTLSSDSRLCNAAVDFYRSLHDHLTPICVPEGVGMVINLKSKVARPNVAPPSPKIIEDKMETEQVFHTVRDDITPSAHKVPSMKLKLPIETTARDDLNPYIPSYLTEDIEDDEDEGDDDLQMEITNTPTDVGGSSKPSKHKKRKSEHKHKKKHKKKSKHLSVD